MVEVVKERRTVRWREVKMKNNILKIIKKREKKFMKFKKNSSKLLCVVLSLIIIISNPVALLANEMGENIPDTYLLEKGYPQCFIDVISEETKQTIYAEDLYYAGGSIWYYDEDTGDFTEATDDGEEVGIQPRGQIEDHELEMNFMFSKRYASDGTLEYIYVDFYYNWLELPVSRFQDPIAVTWDEDLFEMQSGSFHKVDWFDGMHYSGTGTYIGNVIGVVHSEAYNYANSCPGGVSWYADLAGYITYIPTRLYGGASFKLVPKFSTSTGEAKIRVHYVHPFLVGSYGFDISEAGNLSLSGGSSGYDEMGTDDDVKW